jgi:AraC-like DNA-binding protein
VIDTLSDVLRAVHLTGAMYVDIRAAEPWAAEAPPARAIAPYVRPGADHVIEFHVVLEGSCWGGLVGEPRVQLGTGDVIVFPQGDAHTMSSSASLPGKSMLSFYRSNQYAGLPITYHEGAQGPADTHVLCGFFSCDRQPFNPLLSALPRLLHASADSPGAEGEAGWIAQFVSHARAESAAPRPGGQSVLTKLSELMFLEVVRRHLAAIPRERGGWLGALRDPVVGRAIGLLHERPAEDWTVEELARACGASRSLLAERFTAAVGIPPMQYLTQWRIQLAAGLLARGNEGIGAIAATVGYESEAAFHRAFKKVVGVAPGAWRRRNVA